MHSSVLLPCAGVCTGIVLSLSLLKAVPRALLKDLYIAFGATVRICLESITVVQDHTRLALVDVIQIKVRYSHHSVVHLDEM
ncbi:hypothetical protein B9Z19DRAFT_1084836 [Tuber borchii]|uniref:Uncharacterized protein n=1 Tax=Tuber borchii TaxID=42251 RepID=A0A2T6ZRN1_TUBBO|nr:hypothetical protein B9Z19DRAFT_1084836 [Tuber borchii]